MTKILIKNPLRVATMNDRREEFKGGHILIENGRIASIGPEGPETPADRVIDAGNMVVLPGFINTHHHLYQTLTRNIPLFQDSGLFDWLTGHYEIWQELTAEAVAVSTQVGILELLNSGVTTTSDHLYLFPERTSSNLIDVEIDAAKKTGIRFQPTRGSMSLGKSKGGLPPDSVVQTEAEIQRDTERLLAKYHDANDGAMIRLSLAPCSPFSVTPELMQSTADFAHANNLRLHTHLAETLDEEHFCLKTFGKRPLDYVESLGWLNGRAWFAHCVHLNDAEIRRMGAAGVGIAHCPTSNLRLGSGIAPVRKLMAAGVKVSLGVDGSASNDSGNMLAEIRNAMLVSRLLPQEEWLSARDVLAMATRGGAAVLGRSDIGELTPGKQADLALFSLGSPEYSGGLSDPLAALVFSARSAPADFVIVKGNILVDHGKPVMDSAALIREQNRLSRNMLESASIRTGIDYTKTGVY